MKNTLNQLAKPYSRQYLVFPIGPSRLMWEKEKRSYPARWGHSALGVLLMLSSCNSDTSSGAGTAGAPSAGASNFHAAAGSSTKPLDTDSPGSEAGISIEGPLALDNALEQIRAHIQAHALPLVALSSEQFHQWFDDLKYFELAKANRKPIEDRIALGELPEGLSLDIERAGDWRLSLVKDPTRHCNSKVDCAGMSLAGFNYVISEAGSLVLHTEWARDQCSRLLLPETGLSVCDEPFQGAFSALDSVVLPSAIELQVEPIQVAGEPNAQPAERDGLAIHFNLNETSIPLLVDYFAVGYPRAALQDRLRELLGREASKWVLIQEFLFGWIRERANTFPGPNDNDVCHGPARAFYYDTLDNYDRSTEAVTGLLSDHYCLVSDNVEPRFGDYLYVAAAHSARYVLKDPASGRDIVFSVQSGGFCPYRFWWADEDMSGRPFQHEPRSDYRQALVDVWRRCR